MARIRTQGTDRGTSTEEDLMQMLGIAKMAQDVSRPPAMDDLLRLLNIAGTMQQQQEELDIRQQAVDVEKEKAAKMDPSLIASLMAYGPAEQRPALLHRIEPDVYPAPGVEQPVAENRLPDIGTPAPKGKPTSRKKVTSMGSFLGYQQPEGDFEAILDEKGNVTGFTKAGEKQPYYGDFVPSVESMGGWGASKYALAQQMQALGRMFGFNRQQGEAPTPY